MMQEAIRRSLVEDQDPSNTAQGPSNRAGHQDEQLTPVQQPQYQQRPPEQNPFFGLTVGDVYSEHVANEPVDIEIEGRDVYKMSSADLDLSRKSPGQAVFLARLLKTIPGTQFTCFTRTKVRILTPEELLARHRRSRT
jgi:hypothetical protein